MGGGGMMRIAAKVTGISSVMHGGLRGSPTVLPSGNSLRTASNPASPAGISAQGLKGSDVAVTEKPWEWQVLGGERELEMSAGEPMPRVVFFGAAPSFEEAREATAELKEALDKTYLSSPRVTDWEEPPTAEVSGPSLFSYHEAEAESVLVTRSSVPEHAYQAFELLSRSAEAQNVVASIASDPNIWNAMMENSAVKQFMESQKNVKQDTYDSASGSGVFDPVSSKEVKEESDTSESFNLELLFNGFVDQVKLTVNTIVSNLSTYIKNIFEAPAAEDVTSRNIIASGFMGLAIMVVMVVLLKRA